MKQFAGLKRVGYSNTPTSFVTWIRGQISSDTSMQNQTTVTESCTGEVYGGSNVDLNIVFLSKLDFSTLQQMSRNDEYKYWHLEFVGGRTLVSVVRINPFVSEGLITNARDGVDKMTLRLVMYHKSGVFKVPPPLGQPVVLRRVTNYNGEKIYIEFDQQIVVTGDIQNAFSVSNSVVTNVEADNQYIILTLDEPVEKNDVISVSLLNASNLQNIDEVNFPTFTNQPVENLIEDIQLINREFSVSLTGNPTSSPFQNSLAPISSYWNEFQMISNAESMLAAPALDRLSGNLTNLSILYPRYTSASFRTIIGNSSVNTNPNITGDSKFPIWAKRASNGLSETLSSTFNLSIVLLNADTNRKYHVIALAENQSGGVENMIASVNGGDELVINQPENNDNYFEWLSVEPSTMEVLTDEPDVPNQDAPKIIFRLRKEQGLNEVVRLFGVIFREIKEPNE